MSRNIKKINETINIIHGSDHTLGYFLDITDSRYADSGLDEQGEGYVMEWSHVLGFTRNLIGADIEDIGSNERLIELTNKFIGTLLN